MTRARRSRLGAFAALLALWVVTALAFWALAALLPGIAGPSFGGALVTTGLIAILRRLRERNTTDVPGVILFEIAGLAEPVLRQALDAGHAPTLARWLEDGSHRIVPWECDLSSQTGASQAGLLLGSNFDMPAFRWYEKERGELVVSNHPKDAAEIERRRSDGGGLLAANGARRGKLVSRGPPRCMATRGGGSDRK